MAASITQYGITWTFDKDYQAGQFVNGDWWVVGPVKTIGIDPPSMPTNGVMTTSGWTPGTGTGYITRTMNGSIVNPSLRPVQGFDSEMFCWTNSGRVPGDAAYSASNNVALNVSASKPLILLPGTSLLSSISRLGGGRPQLTDIAVLTVLDSPPPEGSFRPPYFGTDKTIKFNISQMIDVDVLPELSLSGIPAPWSGTGAKMSAAIRRVWIEHFYNTSNNAQFMAPSNNMPSYGREYETFISEISMLLMSDGAQLYSVYGINKKDLAIGICQVGIDLYAVLKGGQYWFANGGLNCGRKWPILFSGVLLDDEEMKGVSSFNFIRTFVDNHGWITKPFAEDQTMFYVDQSHYDATHVPYWGDASHKPYVGPDTRAVAIPYELTDIGLPEWGIENQSKPQNNNKNVNATYRDENGSGLAGIIMAAIMLEDSLKTKTLWNNDAIFDYMDRYMTLYAKGTYQRQRSKFLENLWDIYRSQWGRIYLNVSSGIRQYTNIKINKINTNAYTTIPLGDVRPRLVIGGSDLSKFVPNINMSFHDDEFFINVNNKNKIITTETATLSNDKITQTVGNETDEFYIDENNNLEYGIKLTEKPASMIIELVLTFSEGLDFYEQKTLEEDWIIDNEGKTLEEYLSSHERPENIINSYAVYCNKANNKYKTGKVCHKYRSSMTDADGNKIWITQKIERTSPTTGIWRLYLDETFGEKSGWQVTIGPTLGYTTAGSSNQYTTQTGYCGLYLTQAASNGNATKVYIRAKRGASTGSVKVGFYNDNAGAPGTLADGNKVISVPDSGGTWYNTAVTGVISSGSKYYPGCVRNYDGTTLVSTYYDSGSSGDSFTCTGAVTEQVNDPAGSSGNARWSLYIDYTEVAADGVPAAINYYNMVQYNL